MSKLNDAGITWLICGQQTPIKKATMPKIEWISEIVEACDNAGIRVFLKNNLKPLFVSSHKWGTDLSCAVKEWVRGEYPILRQGFPND